jgi:ribosomal protein S18 acetylase RimI-like enzyme
MLRIRSLREVRSRELRTLFDEEVAHWARELEWEYSEVVAAIGAGLDGRTVEGCALVDGPRPVAYCYWLREEGRVVVGSTFASERFRDRGLEEDLLDSVIAEVQSLPGNARIEGQTLFSTARRADESYARAGFKGCDRHYLVRSLAEPSAPASEAWRLRTLSRADLGSAADLVFRSHVGTIDASLNSTYASIERARHFVESLVMRDACGRFEASASFVAEDAAGPAGVILCSRLSDTNGHICQVSVAPCLQRRGLGTGLMLAAVSALRRAGFSMASLSVTVENQRACRLYARLGFQLRKTYGAHAWVRAPGRLWM